MARTRRIGSSPRTGMRGFTLIEVLVSAMLIGTVLIGMNSVLITYSASRIKVNSLATARYIIQSEIDDVLMHQQIENSLISDTQGRSRPVFLSGINLLVSNYFYCNFPEFPSVDNVSVHNTAGAIWDIQTYLDNPMDPTNRFANPPGHLYSAGGLRVDNDPDPSKWLNITDSGVHYVARLQLFGMTSTITQVEQYINGATSSAQPHGAYLDSTAIPSYMIADTCANLTGLSFTTPSLGSAAYNTYRSKIFVVRVYDRKTYYTGKRGFMNNGGGAKTELAHGYVIINGQIRL